MTETITGVCDRCGTEFYCEKGYRMIDFIDRSADSEPDLGSSRDRNYAICQSCSSDFQLWLMPDINSKEKLLQHYEEKGIQ